MPLTLLVCPHDTANNPERWYVFVQYLVQKLGVEVQFTIMLDFADFQEHLSNADIVYANPTDTLHLIDQRGFVALARPSNIYDEVVFVANHEISNPTLESLHEQPLSSVSSLLPTKLALHLLKARSIIPSSIENHESWLGVIGSVWRNEVPFGIVYKDTYDELSEQGKSMVHAFSTSDERVAFHNILVGRNASEKRAEMEQLLLHMHSDEQGAELLQQLHVEKWVPTTDHDMGVIRHIVETY